MKLFKKLLVAICVSAIGGGITIYFKLNYTVARMVEIATSNEWLLSITLIISGFTGILTLIILNYWPFKQKPLISKAGHNATPDEAREIHRNIIELCELLTGYKPNNEIYHRVTELWPKFTASIRVSQSPEMTQLFRDLDNSFGILWDERKSRSLSSTHGDSEYFEITNPKGGGIAIKSRQGIEGEKQRARGLCDALLKRLE